MTQNLTLTLDDLAYQTNWPPRGQNCPKKISRNSKNFKILWGWLGPPKGQLVWWAAPSDGFVKFLDAIIFISKRSVNFFMAVWWIKTVYYTWELTDENQCTWLKINRKLFEMIMNCGMSQSFWECVCLDKDIWNQPKKTVSVSVIEGVKIGPINYSTWNSNLNFEFQPKFGIQLGIPSLIGINLGEWV